MRQTARHWRYAVDHHIAPGVMAAGKTAANGIGIGVDYLAESILGTETKEKVDETVEALSTIAKAVVDDDDEQVEEYQDYYYSPYMEPPESFHYQQLSPYDYPPGLEAQESVLSPQMVLPVNARRQDDSSYQTNFSPVPTNDQSVEDALYVLGKNIFGENVTDRLLPVAKRVAHGFGQVGDGLATITEAFPPILNPAVEYDDSSIRLRTERQNNGPYSSLGGRISSNAPRCTTPRSGKGRCMDIQNCPLLLADLDQLRKSICFKSLFVPGVCCPDNGNTADDG